MVILIERIVFRFFIVNIASIFLVNIQINRSCVIEDEIVLTIRLRGNIDIGAVVNMHNVIYNV